MSDPLFGIAKIRHEHFRELQPHNRRLVPP